MQKLFKRLLKTIMEQTPIFIPQDEIAIYPDQMEMPDDAGRLALKAKGNTLHGYSCKDITSKYMWNSNGSGKGFKQTLMCRFAGSMANFNYMLRFICNRFDDEHRYVILLPRKDGTYCVFGNSYYEIDIADFYDIGIADKRVEHQTFVLECAFQVVPFPYYDGPVDVTYCTGPELIDMLYRKDDLQDNEYVEGIAGNSWHNCHDTQPPHDGRVLLAVNDESEEGWDYCPAYWRDGRYFSGYNAVHPVDVYKYAYWRYIDAPQIKED